MKNWRINLIFTFFGIFWAAIFARLIFLQIFERGFYQAQALGQQMKLEEVEGQRGEIFFKGNTKSLAINKEKWQLYLLPKEIKDKKIVAETLANILNISSDSILLKIEKEKNFLTIKSKLTDEETEKLKNLRLEGVHLEKVFGRYYPQNNLASQVVGFLGGDGKGQYGLEGYYNDILKGEIGYKEEVKGFIFSDLENLKPTENGSSLYLTIDYNIQFIAESLLKDAEADLDIEAGQIIVLEPKTGKIIALANFPNFNPNEYSKEKNFEIFQNGAIQKIFEPGSSFKAITMAIALNEGKITPETTYYDKGFIKVGAETIYNYDKRVYGQKSMAEVLEKSINTGAVFAVQSVPKDIYLKYLDKFGINEKTGIDLQGEIFSINTNLKNGKEINLATASFGQGIEMTPLNLAQAFCVIANGGKLIKPYVVEKIIDGIGTEIETQPVILEEGILTNQTVTQLTTMLINVVENGYGKKAKVPGYYIAGKTGTAEVPVGGKYDPNKTIQGFAGFAPALNPRFVILVKLDNPKVKTAEYSAAPVFGKLAKYILDYWQIPPDYE